MRIKREKNQVRAGDVRARPRPLVVKTGGGTITKTVGGAAARHVRAAIEAAAASGQGVTIQATFRDKAGNPRTRRIDRAPVSGGGGAGGGPAPLTPGGGTGAGPLGPVQVTAGPGGIKAKDLLDYLDDYYDGDVWAFLEDLWDWVYE